MTLASRASASLLPVTAVTAGVAVVAQRRSVSSRRRATVANAVARLGRLALSARQPDELLREALRVGVEVMGTDYGTAIRRLDDGRLRVAEEIGPQPLRPGTILPLAADSSYVLRVLESAEPFVSRDLRRDPRITPPWPLLARGIVSGLAVPVQGAEPGALGVLALHSRRRRRFTREDVAGACALASVVGTAWEQAAQMERLAHQAMHDSLTGLPNRALFLDRLDRALGGQGSESMESAESASSGVAVLLADLDDFKAVNDRYGHPAGDQLLVTAGRRLQAAARPEDTVARLGGDEFGLVCENVPDEATALKLARRLQGACGPAVDLGGASVLVSASVGMSWTPRTHTGRRDASALLAEADAALYSAKEQGDGHLQVFDSELRRATRRRQQLEAELREGSQRGELRVHYQPVRRPGDLAVVGVEALLRWQHPVRGLLLPEQFLPAAEHTGLLVPIGTWALRTACQQASWWQRHSRGRRGPMWVSVNLSARQLDEPSLVETVIGLLGETGLGPGALALEVSEASLVPEPSARADVLRALAEAGAQVFLDDFGAGLASMTHLSQAPVQAVKIDGSLTATLPGRRGTAMVSSVVDLGAELGLTVVAEGVETREQLQALEAMGCPAVQGHLLDRPDRWPQLDPLPRPAARFS